MDPDDLPNDHLLNDGEPISDEDQDVLDELEDGDESDDDDFDLEAMLDKLLEEIDKEDAAENAIRAALGDAKDWVTDGAEAPGDTDDDTVSINPVAVPNSNPITRVRAAPMLNSVRDDLGWGGFLLTCRHPEMVLVYDLETYGVEAVPLEVLPERFTTQGWKPEAFWCREDYETLRIKKEQTRLVSTTNDSHQAVPVLIAPPRQKSREAQHTALLSYIWWNKGEAGPETTTSQHGV